MRRFKFLSVLVILALMLSLLPYQVQPVWALSTGIVISQVYGGGGNTGATYRNDFIELFNRGTSAINVSGWSVQYASYNGSSWQVTNLSGTIQPGQYFLVQEAAGAGGTVDLPAPDATGNIPMSATHGKVALVNTTGTLSGTCPAGLVDFVGFGTDANCFEAAPTPMLSNTTAALRLSNGCQETDNNQSDFSVTAPAPRNTASTTNVCPATTNPSGIGLAAPAAVLPGVDTLLTVAVTPGTYPTSTSLAVAADLTAIGGSAAQSFFDDGTHGDAAIGDNIFSFLAAVLAGTTPASLSLPATITDAQARSASAAIALVVLPPVQITALSLKQSVDQSAWSPVNGNMFIGYKVNIDPAVPFYYLDVASLTANRPLAEKYYPFFLDVTQLPSGFYGYWAAKGVDVSAVLGTWEEVMWRIINGVLPMFYLKVSPTAPTYMLVDGLQHEMSAPPDQLLRVNGDYPHGTYVFNGAIEDQIGSSSPMIFNMNFSTLPNITTLTLQQAVDPLGLWIPVGGSWTTGFMAALDTARPYYYFIVDDLVTAPPLEIGYHPFILDVTSVPAGYYAYWDSKGVNAAAAAGTPEAIMWQIINGNLPMFLLRVSASDPAYILVDGQLYALGTTPDPYLRIFGDYPAGTYRFNGEITTTDGEISNLPISITFSVNAPIQLTSPALLRVYEGVGGSGPVAAVDPDGAAVAAAITAGGVPGIEIQNIVPADALGGSLTATLAVSNTVPAGTYNVEITFTNNDPFPQSSSAVVQVIVFPAVCPAPSDTYLLQANIGTVQGAGLTPAVTGNATVRGTITNRSLNGAAGTQYGFYIQDAGDGNPLTSDGLFVFTSSTNQQGTYLPVGSPVMVSGAISDFNKGTQIAPAANGVVPCGVADAITPVTVNLPDDSDPLNLLEKYENMLVNLPQTFTIDQNYFQGRYGQITISPGGRLYAPTNGNFPGTFAEVTAQNQARMLVLDDNNYIQNPSPTPYLSVGSYPYTANIFDPTRAGDLIQGVTGILDQGATNSSAGPYSPWYRLQPTVWPTITRGSNPRTSAPVNPGGEVKVAGFNLLNYFTTLDMAPYRSTPPYDGGSNTPRGADNAAEFARQKAKTVLAILNLGADVTGVIELENNGAAAIADLVEWPQCSCGSRYLCLRHRYLAPTFLAGRPRRPRLHQGRHHL